MKMLSNPCLRRRRVADRDSLKIATQLHRGGLRHMHAMDCAISRGSRNLSLLEWQGQHPVSHSRCRTWFESQVFGSALPIHLGAISQELPHEKDGSYPGYGARVADDEQSPLETSLSVDSNC